MMLLMCLFTVSIAFLSPHVGAFSPLFQQQLLTSSPSCSSSVLWHQRNAHKQQSSPPPSSLDAKAEEKKNRRRGKGSSTKAKRSKRAVLLKNRTHPRNAFQGSYDMEALCIAHPPLTKFIKKADRLTIAFDNPQAVRALNSALLASYYNITSWQEHLPPSSLCPPVPGRADYIHYIADILAESLIQIDDKNDAAIGGKQSKSKLTGPSIRGLDIGTGASLIYPLIGAKAYGWSFIATDINTKSLLAATRIATANSDLLIDIRKQTKTQILRGILSQERIDFCMCNPPFYESRDAYERENARKVRNLASTTKHRLTVGSNNFGGGASELWCPGGEVAFISTLMEESRALCHQCLWFSSLVSRRDHIPLLQSKLKTLQGRNNTKKTRVQDTRVVTMGQGQKSSTILFWSFHTRDQQRKWHET